MWKLNTEPQGFKQVKDKAISKQHIFHSRSQQYGTEDSPAY